MADSKRKLALLAEAKEVMREKMQFTHTLNAITETEDKLLAMLDAQADPSNARIGAARTLLDSKWKRIDRILPALKAIELSQDSDNPLPNIIQVLLPDVKATN